MTPAAPYSLRAIAVRLSFVLVRLIVGGVFLYAGMLKAVHPGQLLLDIQHYQLVSDRFAWLSAGFLPYLEIVGGLALLGPKTTAAARYLLAGVLLVFLAALISAWTRGLNVSCGCFGRGSAEKAHYAWWVIRDLGLLVLLGFTAFESRWSRSGPQVRSRP